MKIKFLDFFAKKLVTQVTQAYRSYKLVNQLRLISFKN